MIINLQHKQLRPRQAMSHRPRESCSHFNNTPVNEKNCNANISWVFTSRMQRKAMMKTKNKEFQTDLSRMPFSTCDINFFIFFFTIEKNSTLTPVKLTVYVPLLHCLVNQIM